MRVHLPFLQGKEIFDFLFASLDDEALQKMDLLLKGRTTQAPTLHIYRVRTIYHGRPRRLTIRARSKKIDIAK